MIVRASEQLAGATVNVMLCSDLPRVRSSTDWQGKLLYDNSASPSAESFTTAGGL